MAAAENYDHPLWAAIYDEMATGPLAGRLADCRRFYHRHLEGFEGRVLEAACGTGLILLPLLEAGIDGYGLDASASMLERLRAKAAHAGIDVDGRLWVADLASFHLPGPPFDVVIVPGNSLVLLTTDDELAAALRSVARHLRPGGRLLFDLRLEGDGGPIPGNAAGGAPPAGSNVGRWHIWTHADSQRPVHQRVIGRVDLDRHLVLDRCQLRHAGTEVEIDMTARWWFRFEIDDALDEAGFDVVDTAGDPFGGRLTVGSTAAHSFWTTRLRT